MEKAKAYNVIIFPYKCSNYEESITKKEALHALINYLYEKERVCICRQDDDYYGLYSKWFPYADIKNTEELKNEVFGLSNSNKVQILNLSGGKVSFLSENYTEINVRQLSERKIHLYFTACQLAQKLNKSHKIQYYGHDDDLWSIFKKNFILNDTVVSEEKLLCQNDSPNFYILGDEIENCVTEHIKQDRNPRSVVLFLNDELKYVFYQPENTENIEHIVPYPIQYYVYEERGVKKMNMNEAVLYAYTLDDDLKKDLLSTKVQRVMDRVGVENDRTSVENAFLRGMLEATERKVLYLQQQLNELNSSK